jgi:hypothetical protein
MYDKYQTYKKNHETTNVKDTEIGKIKNEKQKVVKARRKSLKHKAKPYDYEEYYESLEELEYMANKTKKNMKTHKKRLKNFIENGHVD